MENDIGTLQVYFESLKTSTFGNYILTLNQAMDINSECIICLSSYEAEDQIIVFTCNANHFFHNACGREVIKNKPECPLCRKNFALDIRQHYQPRPQIIPPTMSMLPPIIQAQPSRASFNLEMHHLNENPSIYAIQNNQLFEDNSF